MSQGTFVPIGKFDHRMVYARSELDSNGIQWYFHFRAGHGAWAFTWDTHLTNAMIDFNDVGIGKLTSYGFL